MEVLSRSFRLERGCSSMRLGRSNRSFLVSDLVSSETSDSTSYARLSQISDLTSSDWQSQSMRITSGDGDRSRTRRSGAWGSLVSKVFSFRKTGGGDHVDTGERVAVAAPEGRKRRRWSSWLPDPQRRWPVQGW